MSDRETTERPRFTIASFLGILLLVLTLYASTFFDEQTVGGVAARLGSLGLVFLMLCVLATQVFAPLSGAVILFVAIKLYGYSESMIAFYCTSMISAPINFMIARRLGRPILLRFLGADGLKEVDSLSLSSDKSLLVTARIFGWYFFDIVSYAIGVTAISIRRFMIYTATYSLIPFAFYYYAFRNLNFHSLTGIATYYGSLLATGVVFAWFFKRLIKKKQGSVQE